MTEQAQEQIWNWISQHKRVICYIAGIVATLGFLMEVFDVIH